MKYLIMMVDTLSNVVSLICRYTHMH